MGGRHSQPKDQGGDHNNGHHDHDNGGNKPPFTPPEPSSDPKPTSFPVPAPKPPSNPDPIPTTNTPPPPAATTHPSTAQPSADPQPSSNPQLEPSSNPQSPPSDPQPSESSNTGSNPQNDLASSSSQSSDPSSHTVSASGSSTLLVSSIGGKDPEPFTSGTPGLLVPSSIAGATQTSDITVAPASSSAAANKTGQSSSEGNNTAKIVGSVVGGIALLLIVLVPAIILLRRRRRERSFSQLNDYNNGEGSPRWSAVYAAAVGYNGSASSHDATYGTVPVHTAQYITPVTSPQASAVGIEEFPSMVYIAPQEPVIGTVYHQQYVDVGQSPADGESPALAVTTGASLKALYHDTYPVPAIPPGHGPSGSQSSNIDSEVAEIMQTLNTIRKTHSASGSEGSSSSASPSRIRNNSDVAGPSNLAATAGVVAGSS